MSTKQMMSSFLRINRNCPWVSFCLILSSNWRSVNTRIGGQPCLHSGGIPDGPPVQVCLSRHRPIGAPRRLVPWCPFIPSFHHPGFNPLEWCRWSVD